MNSQGGYGGTEMMKAIRAALVPSGSQDHLRIVCFLTDGYVGNDLEVIGEVQKHPNARVFAYGIGNSVNRFLIESMAKAGRGDSEIVTLNDKADVAAHRLYQRLRSPVLTDVSIDWRGLPVSDVLPKRIPDVFAGKPVVLTGRYTAATTGSVVIHAKRAGEDFIREVPVHFNNSASADTTLASFWARRKIDDLMSQDWSDLQTGNIKPAVQKEITQLGLTYKLMTQFTSFVAVEERVVTTNGKPQRVEVPVEMPEGFSYEGISLTEKDALYTPNAGLTMWEQMGMASKASRLAGGGGIGSGSGGGMGVAAGALPAPPPPPATKQEISDSDKKLLDEDVAYIITDKERVAFKARAPMPDAAQPSTAPDTKPTAERVLLESKLSPAVLDSFDCWKKDSTNCKLAPDGAIEIQLVLTDHSENVIEHLKALGLQISADRPKEKVLTGRLQLNKLLDLAKLQSVKFIAPLRR